MTPGSAESPNRSRWMRAYGQGLMEHPSWACTTPPTWSAPALDTGKSARRSTSKTLNTPRWWWLPLS
jgi:hypothetical protein